MISQVTTIEDLHDLYPADTSQWSQMTTRVYVSQVRQMTVGVVERLVVAYCSTVAKLSWTELEANWSRGELQLELTIVRAGYCFYIARNRLTGHLLPAPYEPQQILASLTLIFACRHVQSKWYSNYIIVLVGFARKFWLHIILLWTQKYK